MFPNNAITKTIIVPDSGGEVCPIILEATTTPRTLLQGIIITKGDNAGIIKINEEIYLDNVNQRFVSITTPVKFENTAITCERANNKPFQFSITYVDYDLTERVMEEKIENASTGAEFYLDKTINYGDTIIIFFLVLFAVFGIVKIIADFFIPRKMDFKR